MGQSPIPMVPPVATNTMPPNLSQVGAPLDPRERERWLMMMQQQQGGMG
jgi:hypothetical protein